MPDSKNTRKVLNEEWRSFSSWLDYVRSKQSDHLNALVGVGIGFVFGFFNIDQDKLNVFFPFFLVIGMIFLHFYSRYFYYYFQEIVIEQRLGLQFNSNLEEHLEEKGKIDNFYDQKNFVTIINMPEIREWRRKIQKTKLYGFPFILSNGGKKVEAPLILWWSTLVFYWYFIEQTEPVMTISVWLILSIIAWFFIWWYSSIPKQ